MNTQHHGNPFTHVDPSIVHALSNRIGFGYIDRGLRLRTTSPILEKLSDLEESTVVGHKISEVFIEFFGCEDDLNEIIAGNIPFLEIRDVNRVDMATSLPAYYDFTVQPLTGSKQGEGLLLVIEEKTDEANLRQHLVQQRNELRLTQAELTSANARLHRLDHLRTLFLSIAAHDIQTPLSIITSYADMLYHEADSIFTPDKVAKTILEQSIWLQTLVDGLLDLRTIESGEFPITLERIDLRTGVEFVAKQFRVPLESRGIQVDVNLPDRPVFIKGDDARIRQVAYNLIGNSAKFLGQSGTITISLSTDEENQTAELIFEDNGPGINPKYLDRLFDLFYRTPKGERAKGSGLGLYIVKTIVDAHQSEIRVESELGIGTRFIIDFPLKD